MDVFPRLIAALRGSLSHPALLGALVLEFAALFILSFLFSLAGLASQGAQGILMAIMAVQMLVMLGVDAFFKAGFCAMAREAVQEREAPIRGLLSGARTYWSRFLVYFLVRALIVLALLLPFLLVSASSASAEWTAAQTVLLAIGLLLIGAAMLFWLLWTSAIIVFEGAGPFEAMARSVRLAHARLSDTLRVALVCVLILGLALLLGLLANMPYEAMAFSQGPVAALSPSPGLLALGAAIDIVTSVIFAYSLVVLTLFVFGVYEEMRAGSHTQKKSMRAK